MVGVPGPERGEQVGRARILEAAAGVEIGQHDDLSAG